jgi:2-succinyl-5-enolpyruvyl-6-hydroxy-3-cyclohexene-1-carboxylate synthase
VDGILHLGGRIDSKHWYEYLGRAKPKHYLMVNNHPLRNDPTHQVTLRVESRIIDFCVSLLLDMPQRDGDPRIGQWQRLSRKVDETIDRFFLRPQTLSEPMVARLVSQRIPKGDGLFLASSLPIREMDMFAAGNGNPVEIGANRGASGIDGTIATATGFGVGLNKRTTLLIGDLAFLHDLNSLAMLKVLSKPVIIVVLNNNGGGIFSFLPVGQYKENFERYFGTPHGLHFEYGAKMFNLRYSRPQTKIAFLQAYQRALTQRRSTIIEITTNRASNYALHQKLQQKIRTELNKLL